MTAAHAVVTGAGDPVWRSVELHGPVAGEVLVRVEAVGVCHTDLLTLGSLGARSAVLGHEGCGIVEAVGPGVVSPVVGDRVVMTYAACRECDQCRAGHPAYCRHANALNASGSRADGSPTVTVDGEAVYAAFFGQSSWADRAIVGAASCVVIGADVDPLVAAPLGCGFMTGAGAVTEILQPGPGDRLVVVGGGAVGLAAALVARQDGADVVVVDRSAPRRSAAGGLGLKAVADLDDVTGAPSHGLDTTGRPVVIAGTLRRLAARGVLVTVGLGPTSGTIDLGDLLRGGKTLRGCIEGDADPRRLIPEILARQGRGLGLERLVTPYPMDQVARAIDDHRTASVVKPVLVPPAPA